ncbi:heme oxygenase [Quadrisphaera granulorum]|uniref:Heme oxygenase n=1 Tax=Quadrisphaera granulorum TaxID=317664 RepID=A0A316A8K1_9ACTN|nr:biliverdin-producing heme oxygenase [Quadrisphaera granulorum]PWJ53963.1 heme oxygenase [Quadrisphaera granulorum]SZE96420.1 heme oxygenase [Quadrisphaera granulorum]
MDDDAGRNTDDGFAARLRRETAEAHGAAERSPFMEELLSGALAPQALTTFLAQVHQLYAVLEPAVDALRHDVVVAPFADDRLRRLPAVSADLRAHAGEDWHEHLVPLPATERYAQRLQEVAVWPAGLVTHHYLRYLGDLSGGQVVRRLLARAYGWPEAELRSWDFPEVPSPKRYRDHYRSLLDAAPWDDAERDRVVEEARRGYRLNEELFTELSALLPQWRR